MLICQTPDRRWLIADGHGIRPLVPDSVVQLEGRSWRVRELASPPTLRFHVSQDEEHVRLELLDDMASVDFGERVHHQSLLLLARERRADERRGLAPQECGWREVSALERMLGMDAAQLNLHVFRARRQVEPALRARDRTQTLVERRCGQTRFGPVRFEIARQPRPWRTATRDGEPGGPDGQ